MQPSWTLRGRNALEPHRRGLTTGVAVGRARNSGQVVLKSNVAGRLLAFLPRTTLTFGVPSTIDGPENRSCDEPRQLDTGGCSIMGAPPRYSRLPTVQGRALRTRLPKTASSSVHFLSSTSSDPATRPAEPGILAPYALNAFVSAGANGAARDGGAASSLEGLYISEPDDEKLLTSNRFRDAYAEGIYRGIVRFPITNESGSRIHAPVPFSGGTVASHRHCPTLSEADVQPSVRSTDPSSLIKSQVLDGAVRAPQRSVSEPPASALASLRRLLSWLG
jgi:hypothetical protein